MAYVRVSHIISTPDKRSGYRERKTPTPPQVCNIEQKQFENSD
jgi:hypothetical protein